jgi:type VI secretion system protein ImpE
VAEIERLSALSGDPDAELARLENEIRGNPGDVRLRTYLFQVLALRGKWDRALSQLQVTAQLSKAAIPMAQTYREAIRCEVYRAEVFAGRRQPSIFGEPPAWAGGLVESLRLLAQGSVAQAEQMRDEALEAAPTTPGKIGDTAFAWIADADSRLGPVCEAIIDGKYVWIPFTALSGIKVEAPTDLRDLVWASGQLTFPNGGSTVALLPARYPGSAASQDPAIQLGRKTLWEEKGPNTFVGLGQRLWATDEGEFPLLEARDIALDAA